MDSPSRLSLHLAVERWPIAGSFAISRGSKTEAVVVVAELGAGKARGRGECVPYARYGESVESVVASIEALRPRIEAGLDRAGLQQALPPGAARNALDCAYWDLEAKLAGRSAGELAGLPPLHPVTTAYTISIGSPDEMGRAAAAAAGRPLLKVKLGRDGDAERIAAVRRAAPRATLIVDANEGWTERNLAANLGACAAAGVTLVEQPLPDGADGLLARVERPIPVCADESAHARDSIAALVGKYDAVNVKLDKAGGLTEALAMAAAAKRQRLSLMIGCMVATSLSMAPALLVAQSANVVDLDGPLLLARDRPDALGYDGSVIRPPTAALWG